MESVLFVKWLHVVSATILVGTGFGSAFFKWVSDRSRNVSTMHATNETVVLVDWIFTTPTVIIQPATGLWLVLHQDHAWSESWLIAALFLYTLAGLCWIPVVVLQIRMRGDTRRAFHSGVSIPRRYRRLGQIWFRLGIPAFSAMLGIFM